MVTRLEADPFPARPGLLRILTDLYGALTATNIVDTWDSTYASEEVALEISPGCGIQQRARITYAGGRPVLVEIQRLAAQMRLS